MSSWYSSLLPGNESNYYLRRKNVHSRLLINFFIFSSTWLIVVAMFPFSSSSSNHHHNTPPVFDFKRDWILSENEPIGSRVSLVRARDAEGDDISYAIESSLYRDGSNLFTINGKTGEVFLKQSLAGKAGSDFSLLITASDGHQTAKSEVYARIVDHSKGVQFPGKDHPLHHVYNRPAPDAEWKQVFQPASLPSSSTPSKKAFSSTVSPISSSISSSSSYSPTSSSSSIISAVSSVASSEMPKNVLFNKTTTSTILPDDKLINKQLTSNNPLQGIKDDHLSHHNDNDDDDDDGEEENFFASNNDVTKDVSKSSTSTKQLINSNSSHQSLPHKVIEILPFFMAFILLIVAAFVLLSLHRICIQKGDKNLTKSWPLTECVAGGMNTLNVDSSIASDSENYNQSLFGTTSGRCNSIVYHHQNMPDISLMATLPSKASMPSSLINMDKWEFPRNHLRSLGILGEGCFGRVWKCEAFNIAGNEGATIVAVKTIKEGATDKDKNDLLCELEIMKLLEPHPNVISLLGCCTEIDPKFLILEYVPFGTLQSYLRESKVERHYGNILGNFTSRDLTLFAYQIAKGMEYISSKGVIHRDLAARNILIGNNKTCKIGDFGFSKQIEPNQVYEKKTEGRLPIRWMSPEALYENKFSCKTDIWSFGILMWEIVTLGSTPYPGLSTKEVMKKVREGYRLEKPEHCKREVYNIMFYCWHDKADERPNFNDLAKMLDQLVASENDYIELDRFPDHYYYNVMTNLSGERL